MAMTRIERLAIAGAAIVAIGAPAVLLGFGREPVPREPAPMALLAPRSGPPIAAAYRRDLFVAATDSATNDAPVPDDAPDLVGIVGRIGQDAVALVRQGGATRTLAVGAASDGWVLESLTIDAAYFRRGGQSARVPLPAGD